MKFGMHVLGRRFFRAALILALISVPQLLAQNVALTSQNPSDTRMVDDYVWGTHAISAAGQGQGNLRRSDGS